MSKCRLLFNEQPIVINRLAAKVLGLNEAIVIQQIHYWIDINEKAKTNFYENRTWTFNTYENWQEENFCFWSVRTLKRIFDSLTQKGILIKNNFNKKKYDRTMWVTINYEKLNYILEQYELNLNKENQTKSIKISTECQVGTLSNSNKVTSCHYSKCQVGTLESDKLSLPIPENTKENTKDICTTRSEDNLLVVNTNQELIETKTHLILHSQNKKIKVSKWNKSRLEKAIEIFSEQEGQYFSLLEKIYKDDRNFIEKKIRVSKKSKLEEYNERCNSYIEHEGNLVNTKELGEKINKIVEERHFSNNNFGKLLTNCMESEVFYNELAPITKKYMNGYIKEHFKEFPNWIK